MLAVIFGTIGWVEVVIVVGLVLLLFAPYTPRLARWLAHRLIDVKNGGCEFIRQLRHDKP